MYSNAGKLIKKYVQIMVKIGYVLCGVYAAIILIAGLASGEFGTFLLCLIIAGIVLGLGCLSVWLGGLWSYAYGEMAERLIKIDEKMDRLIPNGTATEPAKSGATSQTGMYCESCGSPISKNAKFCNKCGSAIQ